MSCQEWGMQMATMKLSNMCWFCTGIGYLDDKLLQARCAPCHTISQHDCRHVMGCADHRSTGQLHCQHTTMPCGHAVSMINAFR